MYRFFGWIVLFTLGLAAQSLFVSGRIFLPLCLIETAGVLTFVLFYHHLKPLQDTEESPFSIQFDFFWLPILLSIVSIGVSMWYMWHTLPDNGGPAKHYTYTLYSWLGFIFLTVAACFKPLKETLQSATKKDWLLLGGLILLSLILGIFRLTSVPFTVHGDEGMVGVYARRILNGNIPTIFSTSWYTLPQFFFWIPSTGLYLFGDNLFGLRMSSVMVGTLSLIPFYIISRSMWGTAAAVFSGILLVCNHWYLHLMHSGVSYVQALLFTTTAFCILYFMNQKRSIALACLGGLILGLGLMSYQANHLLPVLWIVSQLGLFLLHKIPFRWLILSIAVPLLIACLVISPLMIHEHSFQNEDGLFKLRAEGVGVWTDENIRHLDYAYKANGNRSILIREQLKRALLAPVSYYDTSIQYSGRKPMLDHVSSVLWMLSAVLALLLFWNEKWSLPLGWTLGVLLTGGAMTVDPPFFPRLTGSTVFYFILIGGLFHTLIRVFDKKANTKILVYGFVSVATVCSVSFNLSHYFNTYANEINVKNIHIKQTLVGYYIAEHCGESKIYLIPGPHNSSRSGTCLFLSKECSARNIETLPQNFAQKNVIILIDSTQTQRLDEVKEKLPGAEVKEHYLPDGELAFISVSKQSEPLS